MALAARYFVDPNGVFLGAFLGHLDEAGEEVIDLPPEGSIEVDTAPADGRQVWQFGAGWSAAPAPPVAAPTPPSPREWLERLSSAKQAAIATAGMSNAQTYLWLMKAMGSASIDVTLPETIAGVAAFVAAGVLDAADQALLLAP